MKALLATTTAAFFLPHPFFKTPPNSHLLKVQEESQFINDLNATATADQLAGLRHGRMVFKEDTYISSYLQVTAGEEEFSSLYFLLAESRSRPDEDPLVVWLTGGPGCSSMYAAYTENGPYNYKFSNEGFAMDDKFKMEFNKFSWNNKANVLYLDQPLGTGFSVTDSFQNMRTNEDDIARDFAKFMKGFYRQYPEFNGRKLYITGESYAGKYIPAMALHLYQTTDIKIAGLAIGNGWVDPFYQYPAYSHYAAANGLITEGHGIVLNVLFHVCQYIMVLNIPLIGSEICQIATFTIVTPGYPEFNVYDIREPCEETMTCYADDHLAEVLNSSLYRQKFGIQGESEWQMCDMTTHMMLTLDHDSMAGYKLAQLLDNDVPVLVYSGDKDYICNWMGGLAWTEALDWSGYEGFNETPLEPWTTRSGTEAGQKKTFGALTFLRVFDAGHMVPMNQPQVAWDMLQEFID